MVLTFSQAKLNNVRDREHFHFPNILSNESAPSKFSGKSLVPEEDEMNLAVEKLTMKRNIVEENSKIISDFDDERAYLRKQLARVTEEVDLTVMNNKVNLVQGKVICNLYSELLYIFNCKIKPNPKISDEVRKK